MSTRKKNVSSSPAPGQPEDTAAAKKAEYERRKSMKAAIEPLPLRHDPYFPANADGLKAALKAWAVQREVDTPYGRFPVGFVYDAIYGCDCTLNMPLLLQALIKELMLERMGAKV